jgi:putative NIF3 family GTP cyclohydrolase 1 type 2
LRVLLDENVPHALRGLLGKHEVETAAYAGFSGYRNGVLMKAAEDAGFDVLVTGDKTLEHEQNLSARMLAVVVLSANSWKIVKNSIAEIAFAVDHAARGTITRVDCGTFVRARHSKDPPAG